MTVTQLENRIEGILKSPRSDERVSKDLKGLVLEFALEKVIESHTVPTPNQPE